MNYRNYIAKLAMPFIDVITQYLKTAPVTAQYPTIDEIEDYALVIQIHPKTMRLYNKRRELLAEFGPKDTFGDVMEKVQELQGEGRISSKFAMYSTTKMSIADVPLQNVTNVFQPR